jgi:hypothetical protein
MLVYYHYYSISFSNENIKNYLVQNVSLYKGSQIQKRLDIQNVTIVAFTCNDDVFQYALFQKGINGRYKFLFLSSKQPLMYDSFIEKIKDKYYLISLGYNKANSYSYIHTKLVSPYAINKIYKETFYIKNQEYFIKYKLIENQSKESYGVSDYKLE